MVDAALIRHSMPNANGEQTSLMPVSRRSYGVTRHSGGLALRYERLSLPSTSKNELPADRHHVHV
jgi:hypothetical protein